MKKLFILLLKYIPVIQMAGILVSNTLCYFDIGLKTNYFIDFVCGNSVTTTFLMIVCSYVFKFCNWHRFIIYSNLIAICITEYDILFTIPITDKQLLLSYYIVATIFSLLAIYSKFHCNHVRLNEDTN